MYINSSIYFTLVVCFWEKDAPIFFSYVCLIIKILLMLVFFTNVIKFLYSFVHTSVKDFLKVTIYFDNTIIDLLLNKVIPYV